MCIRDSSKSANLLNAPINFTSGNSFRTSTISIPAFTSMGKKPSTPAFRKLGISKRKMCIRDRCITYKNAKWKILPSTGKRSLHNLLPPASSLYLSSQKFPLYQYAAAHSQRRGNQLYLLWKKYYDDRRRFLYFRKRTTPLSRFRYSALPRFYRTGR